MGIFNKGNCANCGKKCNVYNSEKLKDGVICKQCIEKFKDEGLIFQDEDLSELLITDLKKRYDRNNNEINEIPIIDAPGIMLKKDEVCYYEGDAYAYKIKNIITRYERKGGSAGIRIAKGVTIGRTSGRSVPIRETVMEKFPGKFYITNKRFLLIASKYGFDLPINKLTSVRNYTDAIEYFFGEKCCSVLTCDVKYITKLCKMLSYII